MSPAASPALKREKSRITSLRNTGLDCTSDDSVVEEDLEVIDLEPSHVTLRSPKVSPPPLLMMKCLGENDIKEAEARLVTLIQDSLQLESRLQSECQPCLDAASQALDEKKSHVATLQKGIEAACAPPRQKSSALGGVTKLQLAEVRQLTRSPPEHVRRALTAIWLVLNWERYRGKTVIQVDEVQVWQLCQKMLGDKNFTSRLQQFDPTVLDEVPHLTLYIARTYLGFQDSDSNASGDEARSAPQSGLSRCSTPALMSRRPSTSSTLIAPGGLSFSGLSSSESQPCLPRCSSPALVARRSASTSFLSSPQKLVTQGGFGVDAWSTSRNIGAQQTPFTPKQTGCRADPWAAVHSGSCLDTMRRIGLPSSSRPSTGYNSRPSSKFVVLAPLDLDDVSYASGACGALFQWLRELVLDRAKHAVLQLEVNLAKESLAAAEKEHGLAQQHVLDLQAELDANRMEQSSQEQLIAMSQQNNFHHSTPTSAGKVDVVTARRRPAFGRRGKWLRPAFDMSSHLTLTMTGLQNTTWWRSCERYKLLTPSTATESPARPATSLGLY